MKGSATNTTQPIKKQSEQRESCQAGKEIIQQSLCQTRERVPPSAPAEIVIEIKPGWCRHHSNGFCKRREAWQFSHIQENCPDHGLDKNCENTACMLRHPQTCKHFLKSRCFFGEKCHLFHPRQATPGIVHSLMTELQIKVNEMTKSYQN